MKFNIDFIFYLILVNVSIVLTLSLKDIGKLNHTFLSTDFFGYFDNYSFYVFISLAPQHKLNIFVSNKKRETNPYPLDFVPTRTNPYRKRSQNEHEKNSKISRHKRIINKRKLS
jgi:hypothetical protein